jgi:hypothetical protein
MLLPGCPVPHCGTPANREAFYAAVMTGRTGRRLGVALWGLFSLGLIGALFVAPAWNGYSLLAHRKDVAAQMRLVLEEHGSVLDADVKAWRRAPTGNLCQSVVRMTARLETPADQVSRVMKARLRSKVEGVFLEGGPERVVASALLLHPGEFALFGCS